MNESRAEWMQVTQVEKVNIDIWECATDGSWMDGLYLQHTWQCIVNVKIDSFETTEK